MSPDKAAYNPIERCAKCSCRRCSRDAPDVEAIVTRILTDGKAIEALTDHATGWAVYTEQLEAGEIDIAIFEEKLFESEKRTITEFLRLALPFFPKAG